MALTLYYAPGTCARVPIICMYEAGIEFEPRLVRFMAGEHRSPEYLAQNPKGKVPTLLVDNEPLTENVAILTYLARTWPESNLLPFNGDPWNDACILSDLAWCSSGLHPIITRINIPHFFCDTSESRRVREMAVAAMTSNFEIIEGRLRNRDWVMGEWSALDAYFYWVWFRTTGRGFFDGTFYQRFAEHARRMEERDSVKKLLELEKKANDQLEKEGLALNLEELGRK